MSTVSPIILDPVPATGFHSGICPAMQSLNAIVLDVARTDIPVLLFGESGTGKDAYAALIHSLSGRSRNSSTKINCMTLSATDLLAKVNEAFRPAPTPEQAGTLFLDGIEELDLGSQRTLLSLLRDAEGSTTNARMQPRLICATSKDPEKEATAGRLRRELYFRINGVCIKLPALRERREDIPSLFDFLVVRHAKELGRKPARLDQDFIELLCSYPWPGNVRELENVAKKFVALGSAEIALKDLQSASEPTSLSDVKVASSLKLVSRTASRRAEREMILKALESTRWNRKRAAQQLRVSYKSLLYKIKQLDVQSAESSEPRNMP